MTTQTATSVAPRTRRRSVARSGDGPRILPLALFVVAVIGLFFLMIFLRIALDRSAFELESLERQIAQAESQQLDMRLRLAELQDPLRIATEAQRMGMTYPSKRVSVVVTGLDRSPAPAVVETPTQALADAQP